jgi:hypothetical protein
VCGARFVPSALLRQGQLFVASRTAKLRAQFDKHVLFQHRQVHQADRIIIIVKLKSLLSIPGAERIAARVLLTVMLISRFFISDFKTQPYSKSSGNSILGSIGQN